MRKIINKFRNFSKKIKVKIKKKHVDIESWDNLAVTDSGNILKIKKSRGLTLLESMLVIIVGAGLATTAYVTFNAIKSLSVSLKYSNSITGIAANAKNLIDRGVITFTATDLPANLRSGPNNNPIGITYTSSGRTVAISYESMTEDACISTVNNLRGDSLSLLGVTGACDYTASGGGITASGSGPADTTFTVELD